LAHITNKRARHWHMLSIHLNI